MTNDLKPIVEEFFAKYPEINEVGRKVQTQEFKDLDSKLQSIIPQWYVDLLKKFPLVHAEIGLPFDFGQPDLKDKPVDQLPLLSVTINDLATLEEETLESFPGCEIIKEGFICIGKDEYSSGEGIYININQENPALLLVAHDSGETPKELLANSQKLTSSFTELFKLGQVV